jgi:hypothetical protein
MKAIPTEYNGTRFRSRLEARWSIALDALGIPWEYEPRRFYLSQDRSYLPDFRLWGVVYAEVKPAFSRPECCDRSLMLPMMQKWAAFTKEHQQTLFVLWGAPGLHWNTMWFDGFNCERIDLSQLAVTGPGYSHPVVEHMPPLSNEAAMRAAVFAATNHRWDAA